MRISISLFFSLVLFSTLCYSQIKTPVKRPVNIGVFTGIGGVNFSPIPGLDFSYKKTIIRVAPGYRAAGGGIIQEILPFSKAYYNCLWIVSVYAGVENEDDIYSSGTNASLTTKHSRGILLTGAKIYFAKRWNSQFQIGLMHTRDKTPGITNSSKTNPYFEFSAGFNIFKTYKNEVEEIGVE